METGVVFIAVTVLAWVEKSKFSHDSFCEASLSNEHWLEWAPQEFVGVPWSKTQQSHFGFQKDEPTWDKLETSLYQLLLFCMK